MSEPLPFEQQDTESSQAFAAFCRFRDLPKEDRSIDVAWRNGDATKAHRRAFGHWTKWATQHNWVERARSYDAAIDAKARQATEKDVIERRRRMLEKHAKQADELGQAAQMILDEFRERVGVRDGMKAIDGRTLVKLVLGLPKMAETAQKLERLAEGEVTERHEHTITQEAAAALSDDEIDALLKERGLA